MKPRSRRDQERLQAEAGRAVAALRLSALNDFVNGRIKSAQANFRIARDLERALDGRKTGFDFAGGRSEWISKQQEETAA